MIDDTQWGEQQPLRTPSGPINGSGEEEVRIGGAPLQFRVQLNVPIKHGDQILTEIVLTEPSFEEMEKVARAPEGDRGRLTLMAVTGLPPSVVRQLRGRDVKAINDRVAQLMGEDESPETGET